MFIVAPMAFGAGDRTLLGLDPCGGEGTAFRSTSPTLFPPPGLRQPAGVGSRTSGSVTATAIATFRSRDEAEGSATIEVFDTEECPYQEMSKAARQDSPLEAGTSIVEGRGPGRGRGDDPCPCVW
jgi:hypothetical protein